MVISNKGARPWLVELKNYKTFDGKPLILFQGDSSLFDLNFYAQNRSISTENLFFEANSDQSKDIIVNKTSGPQSISFKLSVGENQYMEYIYTVKPESYMVDFDIRLNGMDDVIAGNTSNLDLQWQIYSPAHEKGRANEQQYTSLYYKFYQDEVERLNPRKKNPGDEEEASAGTRLRWVAFKQQFFSAVLISDQYFDEGYFHYTNMPENSPYLKKFTAELAIPYKSDKDQTIDLGFYFGPNHYQTLRKQKIELEELIDLGGWLIKWINRFIIIPIFNWLNNFIGNYGIIILLLTIIIKLGLFPLTYRSYLSQAKMRVLKPQLDEINAKIPKEKAMERQQATMALYKKAGVNPMGGCLPMLLQFPILIAMFRFFPTSIELRQEGFLWAKDLSTYDSIMDLPFTIPFYGDHVSLFTLLMTISTIITVKINNQTTSANTQMPGMQTMMYIMPVMFMFILNSYSAGLTYYYFLANMITYGQNFIFKRFVNEEEILKKLNENKKKPVKKSGFQKRLEEAAKARGYKPSKK